MQKNSLMKRDDSILRVLECHDDEVLVIDCKKLTMPTWKGIEALDGYIRCEDELDPKQYGFRDMDVLSALRLWMDISGVRMNWIQSNMAFGIWMCCLPKRSAPCTSDLLLWRASCLSCQMNGSEAV